MLPVDTTIAFHVTSLDVIHGFGRTSSGSRPTPTPHRQRRVHDPQRTPARSSSAVTSSVASGTAPCTTSAEWYARRSLRVWAKTTERQSVVNTVILPAFAYSYVPDANGADGGYYPDNVDPYSKVEIYGASP